MMRVMVRRCEHPTRPAEAQWCRPLGAQPMSGRRQPNHTRSSPRTSSLVIRSAPLGIDPCAYAIHPVAGSCAATPATHSALRERTLSMGQCVETTIIQLEIGLSREPQPLLLALPHFSPALHSDTHPPSSPLSFLLVPRHRHDPVVPSYTRTLFFSPPSLLPHSFSRSSSALFSSLLQPSHQTMSTTCESCSNCNGSGWQIKAQDSKETKEDAAELSVFVQEVRFSPFPHCRCV